MPLYWLPGMAGAGVDGDAANAHWVVRRQKAPMAPMDAYKSTRNGGTCPILFHDGWVTHHEWSNAQVVDS